MPRGGLLFLCALLFLWQPSDFAIEAAWALPSVGMRGVVGAFELIVHGIAAALSIAAGWGLWQGNPGGPTPAAVAIAASAIVGVQSLYWSILPSNVFPSDRLLLAALIVGHAGAWLVYLRRSKRVR